MVKKLKFKKAIGTYNMTDEPEFNEQFWNDITEGYFGFALSEGHPLWSAYLLWKEMKEAECPCCGIEVNGSYGCMNEDCDEYDPTGICEETIRDQIKDEECLK